MAAPNVWNSLPIDIRNTSSLSTFRNKLKTHFFTAVYTWRDITTTAPLYLVPRQTPRRSTNMVLCYAVNLLVKIAVFVCHVFGSEWSRRTIWSQRVDVTFSRSRHLYECRGTSAPQLANYSLGMDVKCPKGDGLCYSLPSTAFNFCLTSQFFWSYSRLGQSCKGVKG